MIQIQFNDETLKVEDETVLSTLLAKKNSLATGFAIAVNNDFIPRSQYETTYLKEGDNISVVVPMSGG